MLPGNSSVVFRHSESSAQKLRIGLMLNRGRVPAYVRSIIEDLKATSYVELAAVLESRVAQCDLIAQRKKSSLLRGYFRFIDARYQAEPDPLAMTDLTQVLSDVPGYPPARGLSLDVILNFGDAKVDMELLGDTRSGVWRFHFGDSRHYPGGSGFLRELIDRNSRSAIELLQQKAGSEREEVLCRAGYSTTPFPSMRLNRLAPIWGSRHFVLQKLWELHNIGPEVLTARSEGTVEAPRGAQGTASPANWLLFLWIARLALVRLWRRLRPVHRISQWKVAVRRAATPLYEDAGLAALTQFRWLESPRGHDWADPFLFEQAGQTWLFFEEMHGAARRGHIACGRLTVDGALVDVRPVLKRPYHLSYPQIIAVDDEIYLVPEAAESGGVELYRAISFPDQWVLDQRLLDFPCVDTTVFRAGTGWKMYTSPVAVQGHAPITWSMKSERLHGPWQYDSQGPISSDAGSARGAGNIVQANGRRIRPSQDCATTYGRALLFNEILDLEGSHYRERMVVRIEGEWLPELVGVHTYNRCGAWEVIDGNFSFAGDST